MVLSHSILIEMCFAEKVMKKLVGFAFLCIALGMILMVFLPVNFWSISGIIVLLLVGYNLFCCSCK